MYKAIVWKVLLLIGIFPFVLPFVLGVYRISIESWTMIDWLVLYSLIYWPTYIVGIVLVVISLIKIVRQKKIK